MKILAVVLISVIVLNTANGENYYPQKYTNDYYGCQQQTDAFCDKVCKLHLAESGFCDQSWGLAKACKCVNVSYDNSFYFNALESQCPLLNKSAA
uniref:Lipolysis-activating peptide 1-beta chain n=1 Tax=Lychas mucronatus TaxID=172552 RepID=LV1B2_LYCMC|nr:RecName: Full=Lipolysis-activating peptide 1-beta chain; Short=LVP1-beta; Flags: Precursor [Lychas mucronatus]